jgi:hypothetical protein
MTQINKQRAMAEFVICDNKNIIFGLKKHV